MVLWDDTGIYDMNYCNRLNSKPLSYLFGFFYHQGRQTELYVLWFWLFKSEHTTEQTFKGSGDCEPWYTVCSGQWNFYVYVGNYDRFPQSCLDVSLSQDTIVHNWKTYQSTWDHAFLSLFSQVHTKNSTWSNKLHICVSMIVEVYDWLVHAE